VLPGPISQGLGVAAAGAAAVDPVDAVVGVGRHLLAVDLHRALAGVALAAGVDDDADRDGVADRQVRHLGADGGHAADHLVARHERELLAPRPDRVQVGVADAAEEDVEGDVVRARLALLEVPGRDRSFALQRGVAVDGAGGPGGGGCCLRGGAHGFS
jgi:hypothetical protein